MKGVKIYHWSLVLTANLVNLVLGNTTHAEHKIHNIVLYPDKHSWCKTQAIKQIVAYPNCNNVEIDNNVCVGACFSYSIPRTSPSSPGEVITPYCDSCQPAQFTWKEVKLTCESDSEEDAVEVIKKVQVINNCSCNSCDKAWDGEHDNHKHSDDADTDVPELMTLMKERGNKEEADEESQETEVATEVSPQEHNQDLENMINVDEEKEKENPKDEEAKIDILHVNHQQTPEGHLVHGPHHSLVIMPDVVPEHHAKAELLHVLKHKHENDDEERMFSKISDAQALAPDESGASFRRLVNSNGKYPDYINDNKNPFTTPSLLQNQFKIHDHEEYLDQLAVESRKDFIEGSTGVLSLPELIYKNGEELTVGTKSEEEILAKVVEEINPVHHKERHHKQEERVIEEEEHGHKAVKVVDVPDHQLSPAVDGTHITYEVKRSE